MENPTEFDNIKDNAVRKPPPFIEKKFSHENNDMMGMSMMSRVKKEILEHSSDEEPQEKIAE